MKQFWLRYKKTPKFGVSILRGITSQGPQGAAEADEAVVKLIEELKVSTTPGFLKIIVCRSYMEKQDVFKSRYYIITAE